MFLVMFFPLVCLEFDNFLCFFDVFAIVLDMSIASVENYSKKS